jgi:hypothetical protein
MTQSAGRKLAGCQAGLNRGDHLAQRLEVGVADGREGHDAFLADPGTSQSVSVRAGEGRSVAVGAVVQADVVLLQRQTEDGPGYRDVGALDEDRPSPFTAGSGLGGPGKGGGATARITQAEVRPGRLKRILNGSQRTLRNRSSRCCLDSEKTDIIMIVGSQLPLGPPGRAACCQGGGHGRASHRGAGAAQEL